MGGYFKVRFGEGGASPYLFAFLKQIEQNLGRSPFWEGYRLGTGCDLTTYSSCPANHFSATDATKSMYDSECTIAIDVQDLGCKDWFGISVIKVCA